MLYIDMDQNQRAINISTELLEIYYDDPDLYYNVGVLYQQLTMQLYNPAVDMYKDINDDVSGKKDIINQAYSNFLQSRIYAEQSKIYFLDANDMEIEDTGSREAAQEMRILMKSIDTFISSIKSIASENRINLD